MLYFITMSRKDRKIQDLSYALLDSEGDFYWVWLNPHSKMKRNRDFELIQLRRKKKTITSNCTNDYFENFD